MRQEARRRDGEKFEVLICTLLKLPKMLTYLSLVKIVDVGYIVNLQYQGNSVQQPCIVLQSRFKLMTGEII